MMLAPFVIAFRHMCRQQPFAPFTVELFNGERLVAAHPEAMTLRDGLVTFAEPDGHVRYFDADSVLQIFEGVVPPRR